jgi:hypothetical protein
VLLGRWQHLLAYRLSRSLARCQDAGVQEAFDSKRQGLVGLHLVLLRL